MKEKNRPAIEAEEIDRLLSIDPAKADKELVRRVRLWFIRHKDKYGSDPTFKQAKKLFDKKYTKSGRKGTVDNVLSDLKSKLKKHQ